MRASCFPRIRSHPRLACAVPAVVLLSLLAAASDASADDDRKKVVKKYVEVDKQVHVHKDVHKNVYHPGPVYAAPPVAYGPRPGLTIGFEYRSGNFAIGAVHSGPTHAHVQSCRYIPGHYATRTEEICVAPARVEQRFVPPSHTWVRDSCGRSVCVTRPGYYQAVQIPARYETRTYQVFVPASWDCNCGHGHY